MMVLKLQPVSRWQDIFSVIFSRKLWKVDLVPATVQYFESVMEIKTGECRAQRVLMKFYRGQFIKITAILQKYQNTNTNSACIISPNAYDEQQNGHR